MTRGGRRVFAPNLRLLRVIHRFGRQLAGWHAVSGHFAMAQSPILRHAIPFFVVSVFLLYFFSSGVQHELSGDIPSILMKGSGQSLLNPLIHYRVR